MPLLDGFFLDLDKRWTSPGAAPLRLSLIGSSALMFQTKYQRGTKDADVLQVPPLAPEITAALVALAGEGTALHTRHRIYLDIVGSGVPFLPQRPNWHPADFNHKLTHFDVQVLDVVDVVVSKLKRFHTNDRNDIDAMINLGAVTHDALVERFLAALDWHRTDAAAERLPQYVQNLNQVERDMLIVPETTIDLDDLQY